jgi:hypothetical protein
MPQLTLSVRDGVAGLSFVAACLESTAPLFCGACEKMQGRW